MTTRALLLGVLSLGALQTPGVSAQSSGDCAYTGSCTSGPWRDGRAKPLPQEDWRGPIFRSSETSSRGCVPFPTGPESVLVEGVDYCGDSSTGNAKSAAGALGDFVGELREFYRRKLESELRAPFEERLFDRNRPRPDDRGSANLGPLSIEDHDNRSPRSAPSPQADTKPSSRNAPGNEFELPDIESSERLADYFARGRDTLGEAIDAASESEFLRETAADWGAEFSQLERPEIARRMKHLSSLMEAQGDFSTRNESATDVVNALRAALSAPPESFWQDTKQAALLAAHTYRSSGQPPAGYAILDRETEGGNGFEAVAYKHNGSGRIIIAFEGTATESLAEQLADWGHNVSVAQRELLRAAHEVPITQFAAAGKFTDRVVAKARTASPASEIVLTGHSLGGGLVQYEAARTGLSGHTFNAPGVAASIQARGWKGNGTVYNHHQAGDAVAGIGTHYGRTLSYREQQPFDSDVLNANLARHNMDNFSAEIWSGSRAQNVAPTSYDYWLLLRWQHRLLTNELKRRKPSWL